MIEEMAVLAIGELHLALFSAVVGSNPDTQIDNFVAALDSLSTETRTAILKVLAEINSKIGVS